MGDDTDCDPSPCGNRMYVTATVAGNPVVADIRVVGEFQVYYGHTPALVGDLFAGDYLVEWSKPGHRGCQETYTVSSGDSLSVNCELVPYFASVRQSKSQSRSGPDEPGQLRVGACPNPTTGPVSIEWAIPVDGSSLLVIFDASGRVVRRLAFGDHTAGTQRTA